MGVIIRNPGRAEKPTIYIEMIKSLSWGKDTPVMAKALPQDNSENTLLMKLSGAIVRNTMQIRIIPMNQSVTNIGEVKTVWEQIKFIDEYISTGLLSDGVEIFIGVYSLDDVDDVDFDDVVSDYKMKGHIERFQVNIDSGIDAGNGTISFVRGLIF